MHSLVLHLGGAGDGGLMVGHLDSDSSGPGLDPCWGHGVEFLGKASLHPINGYQQI